MMRTFNEFIGWESKSRDTIDFKKVYVDMSGDLIAGLVLSELIYWYLPSRDGKPNKLSVFHEGELWIAVRYKDWWERARLTESQAERAIRILVEKGIVIKDVHKFNGEPTLHLRIAQERFVELLNSFDDPISAQKAPMSASTENDFCDERHPVTESTTENTTTINGLSKIDKPKLKREPCDQDGITESMGLGYGGVKTNTSPIKENVRELTEFFSSCAGVKPPPRVTKADYKAFNVTWWSPLKEMLRQCDDNVALTSELLERAIEKQRKSGLPTGVPKSLLTSFMAEVSLNSKPKQMAKDPDGNWVEV